MRGTELTFCEVAGRLRLLLLLLLLLLLVMLLFFIPDGALTSVPARGPQGALARAAAAVPVHLEVVVIK